MTDAVNLDISPTVGADVVHDLRRLPWPFEDNSFREIWLKDVIEHLPDTVATMEELHRIGKPGCVVHVATPHFSSSNSFTDPTHYHHFGYFSFDYFTGHNYHDHYTVARFRYAYRQLIFVPSIKNTIMRRLANRWPGFYEQHLCWMWPAWFISVDLVVEK